MATVAMMIGGAVVIALAFSGSSFLFSSMSGGSEERKRHDLAIEKLQKAQVEWQQKRQDRIDLINKQLILEKKAEGKFTELNEAMRAYETVFGKTLKPLPPAPVLSDFYTPSDDQRERELVFIALGMAGIGAALYFFER